MYHLFFNYWAKYCRLGGNHLAWLREHAHALPGLKAGQWLFEPGQSHNYLNFVLSGLLAGAWWDEQGNRHLVRMAPPSFNLLSTQNIHTNKQISYHIIALRDSEVLRIPVAVLKDYQEHCPEASVLVHVLRERNLKQLSTLCWLMSIKNEVKRYEAFCEVAKKNKLMGWLLAETTQQEQQEYLNISESSITRARRGTR